jgi:hypothetical protein
MLNRANAVPGYLFRAHPERAPGRSRQDKSLSGARDRAKLDCLGVAAAGGQGKPWIAFAAQKFTGSGNPTSGITDCCARAAIGHAAEPPSSVMKSRRVIRSVPQFEFSGCPVPVARLASLQNYSQYLIFFAATPVFLNRG